MTHFQRPRSVFRFLLCLLALLCAGGQASAGNAALTKDITASPLFVWKYQLAPNVVYTLETRELQPASADTVVHVVSAVNGDFIAGNDDELGGGTLGSKVTIPTSSAFRMVNILVRAYSTPAAGSCILRLTENLPAGATVTEKILNFGGSKLSPPGSKLGAASHVFTVQEPGGDDRTSLLLVSSVNAAKTIAFDADSGVGRMSALRLAQGCQSCQIVVGTRHGSGSRPVTVVWDEDAEASHCDDDGLSDALDIAVGADPCNSDSDDDGINDGLEAIGAFGEDDDNELEFPKWGASPTLKDLFVELDWVNCDPATAPEPCNAEGKDSWRLPPYDAWNVVSAFAPDVRVHLDTGVENDDPATRTWYNKWGGAKRISDGTEACEMLSPWRQGLFHHGILNGHKGGGQASGLDGGSNGYCFVSGTDGRTVAHELAHGTGLGHGGVIATPNVNCTPTYRSLMNYGVMYNGVTKFSRNAFAGYPLDPTALDESAGLGPWRPEISFLAYQPYWFNVDTTTGAIDWNRNGIVGDPGLVRAAINWADEGCEQSVYRRETLGPSSDPTLVRTTYPEPRLYLFSRTPNGTIRYRFTQNLSRCNDSGGSACATWTPPSSSEALTITNATYPGSAIAASEYTDKNGVTRLMIVYVGIGGTLRYQTTWLGFLPQSLFTPPALVGDGTEMVTGDPALIAIDGGLALVAISDGKLRRWDYSPLLGWSQKSTPELFLNNDSEGNPVEIEAKYGVALATGFQSDTDAEQIYAAIPDKTSRIFLARLDQPKRRWEFLNPGGIGKTRARPGLAYVPFSTSGDPRKGRFYLAYNAVKDDGTSELLQIRMSVDNTITQLPTAPVRKIPWQGSVDFGNVWLTANGGVSLLYDWQHDDHLRAAYLPENEFKLTFAPIADGIVKRTLKDQDDYAVIRTGLACSLTKSCSRHVYAYEDGPSGTQQLFGPGSHGPAAMTDVRNNRMGALEVPRGFSARLCSDSGGFGDCQIFEGKVFDVGFPLKNNISNIEVWPGATLYSAASFGGTAQTFPVGTFNSSDFVTVQNDKIYSIFVAPGMKARLCSEAGGWGECQTFTGLSPTIGGRLKNGTSFVQVSAQ